MQLDITTEKITFKYNIKYNRFALLYTPQINKIIRQNILLDNNKVIHIYSWCIKSTPTYRIIYKKNENNNVFLYIIYDLNGSQKFKRGQYINNGVNYSLTDYLFYSSRQLGNWAYDMIGEPIVESNDLTSLTYQLNP
jgi:hypothetical protein